jgi:hypothetical protein
VLWRNCDGEADVRGTARSDRRKRPLVGRVAAEPTVGLYVQGALRSCLTSQREWCANGRSAFEYLNDDHWRAAVPADEDRSDSNLGIVGLASELRHDTWITRMSTFCSSRCVAKLCRQCLQRH